MLIAFIFAVALVILGWSTLPQQTVTVVLAA